MVGRGIGISSGCRCGQFALLRTSRTVTNPGSLFHGCPYGSEVEELERDSEALQKSVEVCESEMGTLAMETRKCEALVCGIKKELRGFEKELQACKMELRSLKNMVGCVVVFVIFYLFVM